MGAHPPDSTAGPAGGRLGADLAAHVEAIVRAAEREARAAEQAIAEHRRSAEEEARRYLAAARLHVDAERAAHAAKVETLSAATRRLADELADAVAALTRELQTGERDADAALPRPPWPAAEPAAAPVAAEPTWSRIEGERAARRPSEPEPAAASADRTGGVAEDDFATPVAESPRATTGPVRSSSGPKAAEPEHVASAGTNSTTEIPVPSAARLVAIEMAVGGSSRAEVEEHLRTQLGVGEPQALLDDVFGTASHASSRLAWGEP